MLRTLGRGIVRASRKISNVSFGGAFAILCFVTILVNVDVLLRYFFGAPILWATEISEAAILYITFLGTERVLRGDSHVKVDVLISRISGRKRKALDLASSCIGLVVSATLTIFGVLVTWSYYKRGIYNPSATELPLAPVIAVIPFGSFLLSVEFCTRIVNSLKGLMDKGDYPWSGGPS